ncbi:Peptidase A1 domain-containing protein [Madurella fahalii]|uniref:Peptidase A1 domain-containing protein n=1 Tax=Madurella fahalii TaxID=1157608 RepID=A0ABQ0GTG6_9PEZI
MQRRLLSNLVWAFTCLSWAAASGPYSGYDVSVLIPFNDQTNPTWTRPVHVTMRVGSPSGDRFEPWIDTGSTGVVLPAVDITGFNQNSCTLLNRGFHYLTSSNILYLGCWITRDLYFNTETDEHPVVHSQVPVLAVYRRIECDPGTDDPYVFRNGDCTTKISDQQDPTGFGFIGIGWGRMDDGKPDGTSDKNPLINVVEIPGSRTSRLYKGFIIKKEGIIVGLTEGNRVGIDFADLPLHKNDTSGGGSGSGTPNWGQIPACIWFGADDPDTDPCQEVSALLDTGIDQSYFRIPTTSGSLPPQNDGASTVVDGTTVTVSFKPSSRGWLTRTSPHESFKVGVFPGGQHDVTPREMRAYRKDGYVVTTFFNSGMHIFRKYEIAHDAQLGRVGFKMWT